MSLAPGDVVLVRTGTGRFWGDDGADHARIADHDSAGPDLEATRWLVEEQGAIMVGSDTSGFEVNPPTGSPGTGIPVHRYLLVDQGVHLGEFHYLEKLSQAGPTRFATSPRSTRSKEPPRALLYVRWPCANTRCTAMLSVGKLPSPKRPERLKSRPR